jgi:penicillin-binding protein 1A
MGYDQPKDMKGATEGTHIDLWRHIMERIHEELGLEDREFERPEGITGVSICTLSGNLASDLCAGTTRTELFAVGSQPAAHCTSHQTYEICTESGKIATEFCPPDKRETRIHSAASLDVDDENIPEGERAIRLAIKNGEICGIHISASSPTPLFPQNLDGFIDDPLIPPDGNDNPVNQGQTGNGTNQIPPTMPAPTPPPVAPTPVPTPLTVPDVPIVDEGPLIP